MNEIKKENNKKETIRRKYRELNEIRSPSAQQF